MIDAESDGKCARWPVDTRPAIDILRESDQQWHDREDISARHKFSASCRICRDDIHGLISAALGDVDALQQRVEELETALFETKAILEERDELNERRKATIAEQAKEIAALKRRFARTHRTFNAIRDRYTPRWKDIHSLRESLAAKDEEIARLEAILSDEYEHGIECDACGNQNAMVRSACGNCGASLPHAKMADEINRLRAELEGRKA